MKIISYALSVLLASTLFGVKGANQDTKSHRAEERDMFATRWQLSKGGIGMVNKYLYIVVKSARNELILKPTEETEDKWYGKSVTKAEVVIVYEGKVWSSQGLPNGFDLSKAVVVSFESDKIRFFDFQAMSGGYYERIGD
ncbi:MAG TPA: hypothetical protein VN920_01935 [Pyrinomonadaceae bacterium]|nr:hypothetical protein [Pyrinomonadaceae bacterium]